MQVTSSRAASWIDMEPLASWVCGPVRRTGGRAPREGIERNPLGSTLLALDAGLDLERNFAGNRDWAFRFDTAKPECIVCFASVQVKDNRKFLLARKSAARHGRRAVQVQRMTGSAPWASLRPRRSRPGRVRCPWRGRRRRGGRVWSRSSRCECRWWWGRWRSAHSGRDLFAG